MAKSPSMSNSVRIGGFSNSTVKLSPSVKMSGHIGKPAKKSPPANQHVDTISSVTPSKHI